MGQGRIIENCATLHKALEQFGIDFPQVNAGGVCFGLGLKYLVDVEELKRMPIASSKSAQLQTMEASENDTSNSTNTFRDAVSFLETTPEKINALIALIKERYQLYKELNNIFKKVKNDDDLQTFLLTIKDNERLKTVLKNVHTLEDLKKIIKFADPIYFSFKDDFGQTLKLTDLIHTMNSVNDYYLNHKKILRDPKTKEFVENYFGKFRIFGLELENCQTFLCTKDQLLGYLTVFIHDSINSGISSHELEILHDDLGGHVITLNIENESSQKPIFNVYDSNPNEIFSHDNLIFLTRAITHYAQPEEKKQQQEQFIKVAINALSFKDNFKKIIQNLVVFLEDKSLPQDHFAIFKIKNLLQSYRLGKLSCFELATLLLEDHSCIPFLKQYLQTKEFEKMVVEQLGVYFNKQKLILENIKANILAADLNMKNQWLHAAVRYNQLNIVKFLLENGAQPNALNSPKSFANPHVPAPLVDAISNNDREMVKLLLRHGSHPYHAGGIWTDSIEFCKSKELKSFLPILYAFLPIEKDRIAKMNNAYNYNPNKSKIENLATIFQHFVQAQKEKTFFQDPNWHVADTIANCLRNEKDDKNFFDILFWAIEKLPHTTKQNSALIEVIRYSISIAKQPDQQPKVQQTLS